MHHHYSTIAEDFDHLWQFAPTYESWLVKQIIEHLDLTTNDRLLDFGAGTGRFTDAIRQQTQVLQATAVDPDADMCLQAAQKAHLAVIQADDRSLFTHWQDHNAVLLKEVIHHLHHRPTFWQQLYQHLPTDGRVLVVTRPQTTQLALFDAAKVAFSQHQPAAELLVAEISDAGFACQTMLSVFPFRITKARWFAMLTSRFMSDLSAFSNDEIAAGIEALDQKFEGDFIDMQDNLLFILAKKT